MREITGLSEADVARALRDTQGVVERALDILMEVGQVGASHSLHALLHIVHTGVESKCRTSRLYPWWPRELNSSTKTLLHKDCSLGSVRNLTTSPC